jgi:hypothetical protein
MFIGFCAWGGYAAYISTKLAQVGITTTGTVVGLDWSSDSDGGSTASPIVEYTVNGKTYSFEGDNSSNPPVYEKGQKVEIIYDPQDPETAQINSFYERWMMPAILIPAMLGAAIVTNLGLIFAMTIGKKLREQRGGIIIS